MPDQPTPEVREFRRSLRETPIALPPVFGPAPDRVEITATFECVCDGGCPAVCYRCIACTPDEPAEVPDDVIEAAAGLIGEVRAEGEADCAD